ncbi:DUF4276 family protein [Pinisolibacter sp.]|uniref:DUF4276 family protein n=1 Tax=Pinisolibacter sp. TaxID=2172024 RepID=UPI003FA6BD10
MNGDKPGARSPGIKFAILIDNDGCDCRALKQELVDICRDNGRPDTLVRIVCQELESWYLGAPQALAEAFARREILAALTAKKFRNPDSIPKPSQELVRRIPEFQKVSGARRIAEHIHGRANFSASFAALVEGIRRSMPVDN